MDEYDPFYVLDEDWLKALKEADPQLRKTIVAILATGMTHTYVQLLMEKIEGLDK